jgi:predicted nucleic acid-binding protein
MLIDTSVWVDHFRRRNSKLSELLELNRVCTHPFVIGELACGNLARRPEVIEMLANLPTIPMAEHDEVLQLVNGHRLFGRGLGWIDMHLLAAARIQKLSFWTADKRLAAVAEELKLSTRS